MKSLRQLLVAALVTTFLCSPSFASAQGFDISDPEIPPAIDSFFDVFIELSTVPDAKCDPCKAIAAEIADVEKSMAALRFQLDVIDSSISMIDDVISDAERMLEDTRKQIEEMNNPKSFVESEGRRYDSSDHAALRRRNANLWKAYKGGRMTSQEYSEEIGKSFDDPEVAEDLSLLKEIIREELKDSIERTEDIMKNAKQTRSNLNDQGKKLFADLEALTVRLEELIASLKDCNDRCTEEDVHVIEDYKLTPEEQSFLDGLFDFFGGLFDEEDQDPFAEIDDFLDGLGQTGAEEEDRMQESMGLNTEEMMGTVPSSFFDIFSGIELPPIRCRICDPIREQIEETEASLNELEQEKADLQAEVDQAYRDMQTVRDIQREAQNALDAMKNPRSSGQLPDGSTVDSSDYAAMNVRNARLWSAYKSGDLTARQVESEWGKSMNDPSVREELNRIKDAMEAELQDVIDRTQPAIDNLNATITANNERLIDLAGGIAAHRAVLEYLMRDLAECEKKCVLVDDDEDPEVLLPDFSNFIFPIGLDFDDDAGTVSTKDKDARQETINVPQECVSPAVSMSRCEQSCIDKCTKSGVRAWQEGNTVYIEDCGICPPPHIDMCPAGTVFDKARCETDGNCECEEKAKSNDGAACYACKQKNKEIGCMIPVLDNWLCDELQEGKMNVAVSDDTGDGGFLCDWFGLFCDEEYVSDDDANEADECFEDECDPPEVEASSSSSSISSTSSISTSTSISSTSSSSISPSSSKSSVQSTVPKCDPPSETEAQCKQECFGTCTKTSTLSNGTKCYECISPQDNLEFCDSPTMELRACESSCDGTCEKSYTRNDDVACYSCKVTSTVPSCPSGTTSEKSACDSQCGQQGGTCSADNNGCYSCTVVNCPSGTYKNECPDSCQNGCNTVGSESGVTCYQCKQDCETVCMGQNYGGPNTDHSNAILSELQGYSCVSGANISVQTATINGCSCIGEYSISVNQTPPVCTGTPCGDVICGGSASCPGGPNETITVNCNWGGWEKIQKHQFRPIIGD